MAQMAQSPKPAWWRGRAAKWALTLGGTGVVIVALFRSLGGVGPVLSALLKMSPVSLGSAVGLSSLAILLGVLRWQAVLRAMGFRLPFRTGLKATLAVWPLVVIAPSRSNELLRAAVIRERISFWAGAGSVLVEKLIDLHALLWIGTVGAALQGLGAWAGVLFGAIAVLWIGCLVFWWTGRRLLRFRRLRRWETKVTQLGEAFRAIVRHPGDALWASALSLVVRGTTIAVLAVLLWGLGADVPVGATVCLAPGALLVGLLPFTLTGIGMRDAAFLWLLRHAGHPVQNPGAVVAATLGYSLVSTWLFAILSLPVMIRAGLRFGAVVPRGPSTEQGIDAEPSSTPGTPAAPAVDG